MNRNAIPYAAGAILLGLVGIVFHDFAMQWQPVRADAPMRTLLAYASASLLVAAGAAALLPKFQRIGAWTLAGFYASWVLFLHGPILLIDLHNLGAWNAIAEISFLTAGGLALASAASPASPLARAARLIAGLAAIMFGHAHFKYADFTATFVPAWIPGGQYFWGQATGAGHFLAGLALLSGVQSRLAATLLAGMMASFVLLLHLPRVIAAPDQHVEWIMLAVSGSLTGAAWLVRKYTT